MLTGCAGAALGGGRGEAVGQRESMMEAEEKHKPSSPRTDAPPPKKVGKKRL